MSDPQRPGLEVVRKRTVDLPLSEALKARLYDLEEALDVANTGLSARDRLALGLAFIVKVGHRNADMILASEGEVLSAPPETHLG